MRFKGKVSGWFYAIVIGVAAVLMPIIFVSAFVYTSIIVLVINLIVLAALELFCIPIVLHNYVELQNGALLIVFGLIKKKIPYCDIAAVSTTHNPLSSFAASFDRIEIKCENKSSVMISLVDKERFFDEIKRKI